MNRGNLSIIDAHQHLWDLGKFDLPWLQGDVVEPLRRTHLMRDYLEAAQGAPVVKTVYMEVNVHPSQQIREAEYVLDLCGRDDNPMCGAVLGGAIQSSGFAPMAERFAANPFVKGFRTVLHDDDRPPGMCLEPTFVDNVKLLGDLNLSFDLCMRPGEMSDAVRLVDQCPKTRFIVDHCGNMTVSKSDATLRENWMENMWALAQRPHVACKISGIVVTAHGGWSPGDLAPNVDFCLDAFGEDRVLFGGDWPVCTLRASFQQWVDALKWIVRDRSPRFVRKLFHDNAMKIYRLDN